MNANQDRADRAHNVEYDKFASLIVQMNAFDKECIFEERRYVKCSVIFFKIFRYI